MTGGVVPDAGARDKRRTPRAFLRRLGRVFIGAGRDFFDDSGPQLAAAVAYYALLSLFPLLLAAVSIAAYTVDEAWVIAQLEPQLGTFLPSGSGEVTAIARSALAARGTAGLLSLVTLLWSGTRVFSALTKALNVALDVEETYGFFHRLLIEIVMFLTIGVLFLVATGTNLALGLLAQFSELSLLGTGVVAGGLRIALSAALLFLTFWLLYRFVPRRHPSWQAAALGATLATGLFLAARPLFLGYVTRFGSYNIIYGSFGIVILLILWAWIVALIVLFGGEIAGYSQRLLVEWQPLDQPARSRDRRQEEEVATGPAPSPRTVAAATAPPQSAALFWVGLACLGAALVARRYRVPPNGDTPGDEPD